MCSSIPNARTAIPSNSSFQHPVHATRNVIGLRFNVCESNENLVPTFDCCSLQNPTLHSVKKGFPPLISKTMRPTVRLTTASAEPESWVDIRPPV